MLKVLAVLLSLALLSTPALSKTRQEIDAQYARQSKLASTTTERAQALQDWGIAARAAGVPSEELKAAWVVRVKTLIATDFHAAFDAIFNADFLPDSPKNLLTLFPEQEAALRKLGQYKVENYNATPPLPFPSDLPLPGRGWGDLSRNTTTPTPTPTPTPSAPAWTPGQFFADANGQPWAVLLKVDPAKKKYLMLTRTWYPKAEPYYLTAEEWGHYILKEIWFDEAGMERTRPMTDKFRACKDCGGEACQYVEGGRARGGHWEQVSSTLQIYTPRRIPISYTKTVCCPGCGGTGWVKR
ncbi:MAG: hypothetical protein KF760_15135 [Candidatus Eremiobacteraeota bacterium]|nr:hypothetical protein [Candidatus Eremiobacteraeota bacterium]MCW5866372.1 hypothetical protein [Candidatus Eremiobacteraeota bacterium]